jgi:hypothetical protein
MIHVYTDRAGHLIVTSAKRWGGFMEGFDLDKFKPIIPKMPEIRMTQIDYSAIEHAMAAKREQDLVDLGFAHVMYERLVAQMRDFEDSIDPDEEVAAYLASFGTRVVVLIDKVGFQNPYYIVFDGANAETGERVRLIQHTTQTSVLLAAVKVVEPRKPRRIGFVMEDDVDPTAE